MKAKSNGIQAVQKESGLQNFNTIKYVSISTRRRTSQTNNLSCLLRKLVLVISNSQGNSTPLMKLMQGQVKQPNHRFRLNTTLVLIGIL